MEIHEKHDRFYQAILDSLTEHIVVLDIEGNIIMTNRAWNKF